MFEINTNSIEQNLADEVYIREELNKLIELPVSSQMLGMKQLVQTQRTYNLTEVKMIFSSLKKERDRSITDDKSQKNKFHPETLAIDFLQATGRDENLKIWHDDYYKYNGTHYEILNESDLKAEITLYLQRRSDVDQITTRRILDVLTNIKGIVHLPSTKAAPFWINNYSLAGEKWISFKNGLVNIDDLLKGNTIKIAPHSNNLFCLNSLPYDFESNAVCLVWEDFLKQALPDESMRDTLQEWFGYNLIVDTSFEKFVILVGEGANGKTVICLVLKEVLGEYNCSAVPLESFNPIRTFPLAVTLGKLANIVPEMGDIDKTGEGVVKQFVSGEPINVERKHRDPFSMTPTARLTFSTNVLPRFSDRSDGLWRRLLLIQFNNQISDESKQNKNLVNANWWRSSGEMPGIFNWALVGLKRLQARGHFIEPDLCKKAKAQFKMENNPARTFLIENCEALPGYTVASNKLYRSYANQMHDGNHKPLAISQFSKEVRRQFPNAVLSENPLHQHDGSRSREWTGIKLIETLPQYPPF
jgi:P4 family phage/plasmid primase-like protien